MTSGCGPPDAIMVGMDRLPARESEQTVEWLKQMGQTSGFVTGFDPDGWPAHAWLLHAMYQNQALAGLGTHHDARRFAIDRGAVEPLIIGEVDLDASTTVNGVPLGYVVRPDDPWKGCGGGSISTKLVTRSNRFTMCRRALIGSLADRGRYQSRRRQRVRSTR